MSYSLNSVKGVTQGIIQGTAEAASKRDTRSLDYSSYQLPCLFRGVYSSLLRRRI